MRGPLRAAAAGVAALALGGCYSFGCRGDASLFDAFAAAFKLCVPDPVTSAKASQEFDAYRIVYERVLPESTGGPALAARLVEFRDEAAALTLADPTLAALGGEVVVAWSGRTRAFVDGFGLEGRVTQAMIDDLDAWLTLMAANSSVALADAIAAERAARPPLASLVGLDMNAFRAAVLPLDRVFRDEFE